MFDLTSLIGWGVGGSTFSFDETISVNTNNYVLTTQMTNAGWDGAQPVTATVTINAGIQVEATTTSLYGFRINALPAGSVVNLFSTGTIDGRGGAGGSAGVACTVAAGAGAAAGDAILVEAQTGVTINFNNAGGTISGGGGGGGGGGACCGRLFAAEVCQGCTCASNGGGGGAGYGPTGQTGGGGGGTNCGNGACNICNPGAGGSGGAAGAAGGAGGAQVGGCSAGSNGGGGAAGNAIDGDSQITFSDEGTINGSRIN